MARSSGAQVWTRHRLRVSLSTYDHLTDCVSRDRLHLSDPCRAGSAGQRRRLGRRFRRRRIADNFRCSKHRKHSRESNDGLCDHLYDHFNRAGDPDLPGRRRRQIGDSRRSKIDGATACGSGSNRAARSTGPTAAGSRAAATCSCAAERSSDSGATRAGSGCTDEVKDWRSHGWFERQPWRAH